MLRRLAALRDSRAHSPVAEHHQALPVPFAGLPQPVGFAEPRQAVFGPTKPGSRLASWRAVSFLVVVVLPVALAAIYYLAIASDQYVAETRFSLRTGESPRADPLASLAGVAAETAAANDAQIVVQFIASRAIVDQLDAELPLRPIFAAQRADFLARLALPASIEALVQYWRHQVDAYFEPGNGTVTVRVRAFAPGDAMLLAQAIVAAAERLVNDLSSRARHDALRAAEADVGQSEARLKQALTRIREFRDRAGLIDPGKTADATATLAAGLHDELVRANAELATLRSYMHDDAPAVRVLRARIRSLEAQSRATARDLTGAGGSGEPALSKQLGVYEQLDSDRKFAETAYQHALAALDQARANADRQQVYLTSFVPPGLPEEPLYPRRWRMLGTVALIAFAVWAIGGLAVQSIRDHL